MLYEKEKVKSITITLKPSQIEKLTNRARQQECSIGRVIRQLLDSSLNLQAEFEKYRIDDGREYYLPREDWDTEKIKEYLDSLSEGGRG